MHNTINIHEPYFSEITFSEEASLFSHISKRKAYIIEIVICFIHPLNLHFFSARNTHLPPLKVKFEERKISEYITNIHENLTMKIR